MQSEAKRVGALYVRRSKPRVRIVAQMDGGGHERGMRSVTLNVPGIVGFGVAAELCRLEMDEESKRTFALRERLRKGIQERVSDTYVNGSMEFRLPGNINLSFAYVEGEAMLMALKDVAVSSGSACTSASVEPSYVLRAMGVPDERARSSLRFGLGRFTTAEEIDYAVPAVVTAVQHWRAISPAYELARAGI
jgi:cysteine desulfurase